MISFALIDLWITFPILLAEFALELSYVKVLPYTSWNLVHRRFSDVWIYPRIAILNSRFKHFLIMTSFAVWCQCLMGVVFFLMFGLSSDLRSDYAKIFEIFKKLLLFKKGKEAQDSNRGFGASFDHVMDDTLVGPRDSIAQSDEASDRLSNIDLEAADQKSSNSLISVPPFEEIKIV